MKILVACEESQAVTIELRERGHEAYSCDILPCSGGHPEWHLQKDVRELLKEEWDMILAFPPCTHLANSGARHFEKKRKDGRQREAIEFFSLFLQSDCPKICIENPVNIISGTYIMEHYPDLCEKYSLPLKPTQAIQPYEYGDPSRKKTCLWLKGLPKLIPTNIVEPNIISYMKKDGTVTTFSADYGGSNKNSSTRRSKTYPGIAKAMAEQWTDKIN